MSAFQGTSLHPSRATHVRTYESNFRDVVARIQTAVQRAQVSPEKYTNVGAVSLRWSNDDMNLAGIEEDLLRAFANGWNIKGEKYLINDQNPNRAIELAVYLTQTVIKFNSETSLLVVIYQGHAVRTGLNQDELSIMGSTIATAPTLNWDIVSSNLGACRGDVLVIMDCCAAATAAMRFSPIEYLVASAFESQPTANIASSFTSRLINVIQSFANTPVTVAELHAKMLAKSAQPNLSLNCTPVHIAGRGKSSITLRPFTRIRREVRALRNEDTIADMRVLVSVDLRGKHTKPDYDQWTHWLAENIPKDVARVKIQATFDSLSTFVLLTVPVEVWDMMEDHEAYEFVRFVKSDNNYSESATGPSGVQGSPQFPTMVAPQSPPVPATQSQSARSPRSYPYRPAPQFGLPLQENMPPGSGPGRSGNTRREGKGKEKER